MSGDPSGQDRASGRFPQFNFLVDLGGGCEAGFQEMSGLDAEPPAVEYRTSRTPSFSALKVPGLAAFGRVVLKRGVIAGGRTFRDWYRAAKLDSAERRTIVIRLLDEHKRPVMTWTLASAWLVKLTGADLEADVEVAVEALELGYEGIAITGA